MTSNRRSALGRIFAVTVITVAACGPEPATAQERWHAKPVRRSCPLPLAARPTWSHA